MHLRALSLQRIVVNASLFPDNVFHLLRTGSNALGVALLLKQIGVTQWGQHRGAHSVQTVEADDQRAFGFQIMH
jgi:hypothetical protein